MKSVKDKGPQLKNQHGKYIPKLKGKRKPFCFWSLHICQHQAILG